MAQERVPESSESDEVSKTVRQKAVHRDQVLDKSIKPARDKAIKATGSKGADR